MAYLNTLELWIVHSIRASLRRGDDQHAVCLVPPFSFALDGNPGHLQPLTSVIATVAWTLMAGQMANVPAAAALRC